MKRFLPILLVLAAGCQTPPIRPRPLPPAEFPPVPNSRIAAQIGHYTLGAYIDPADPLIRHEAHAIQRLEREARWDLRPAPVPRVAPAVQAAVVVADPDPVFNEAAVPSEPVADVTEATPPILTPSFAPPPKPLPPELVPALVPNADGVLDLTAIAKQSDPEVNPFAVRDNGPAAVREITLQVSGVAGGTFPCAIVNGRTVEPGESTDSLTVTHIEADSVLFRLADQLIRIPVGPKAARIRFAL